MEEKMNMTPEQLKMLGDLAGETGGKIYDFLELLENHPTQVVFCSLMGTSIYGNLHGVSRSEMQRYINLIFGKV